jgi:hypothetical protein
MERRKQNIKTAKLILDHRKFIWDYANKGGRQREGKIIVVVIRVLDTVGYPHGLGIGVKKNECARKYGKRAAALIRG